MGNKGKPCPSIEDRLKHEGSLPVQRGAVVHICGSRDFFVSLGSHPGWDKSFTVFGKVDEASMAIVERVVRLPIHNVTHPNLGTLMSLLNSPLNMKLSLGEESASSNFGAFVSENPGEEVHVEFVLKGLQDGGTGRVVVTKE